MVADRTPTRFLIGANSERFGEGFVVALLLGMTAVLVALLAATMAALDVTGPFPVGLLVTAVGGVAAVGALLYSGLGAGVLSGGAIAAAPYLSLLALALVADAFPYPIVTPAADLQFFAIVGVGLAVIGTGFHELPRLLADDEASDVSDTDDDVLGPNE